MTSSGVCAGGGSAALSASEPWESINGRYLGRSATVSLAGGHFDAYVQVHQTVNWKQPENRYLKGKTLHPF